MTFAGEQPVGRFYQNPLPVTGIGDPFILPTPEGYRLFATGGSIGFFVWPSEDLLRFPDRQKALPKVGWAVGDYWAPEVYEYGGRYVMLFSARRLRDKSLRVGIAFSDTPEGPYVDPLGAPLFDFGYAVIDAGLFVDADGTPYLLFVRDCSENLVEGRHESHVYGMPLSADLLTPLSEPVLLTKPDQAWETRSEDWRWNEGPALLRHDGRYYLFYSGNHFEDKAYGVGVTVADSPLGPYEKPETNPLLSFVETPEKVVVSGPGHNSFFEVGGQIFTAYHTHTYPLAPSGNRQLNLDTAGFHADGTAYLNGPTRAPQLRPLALLGLRNHTSDAKGEGLDLLADGDLGVSTASAAYAWHGTSATLAWETPCRADMILLNAPQGSRVTGRATLNGTTDFPLDFGAVEDLPGAALVLSFE
ncbi:MAG TPA: glycoside hydrolase family 43 protein, partial [Clostridia bacterium]|nr:glycoside hydrolase family 43 protein [Clostridia bacterium]